NASANGRRLARDLAAGLGEAGVIVVSGMARGIDAAAHIGALATGSIAVVAGGIDVVYPEENRGLYEALAHDGAIIAELPLGTEPQVRPEEHTTELQSREKLVCRLVHEKKRLGAERQFRSEEHTSELQSREKIVSRLQPKKKTK